MTLKQTLIALRQAYNDREREIGEARVAAYEKYDATVAEIRSKCPHKYIDKFVFSEEKTKTVKCVVCDHEKEVNQ